MDGPIAPRVVARREGRQAIADSWTQSIDDSYARRDWGWAPKYDLTSMTKDMLMHLAEQYQIVGG